MLEFVLNVALFVSSIVTGLFLVVPYLFLHWKTFKNRFLFSGVINYPNKKDKFLHEPAKFGLEKTTHHSIQIERGRVNLWVMEPLTSPTSNMEPLNSPPSNMEPLTSPPSNMEPVTSPLANILVLYCHGASSNRGKGHRVEFYQVLQQLGYTVVAFDYRGFGDSQGTRANDSSVIEDCCTVLEWVMSEYPGHEIVVWGHSLGSGISTKFLSQQSSLGRIRGLVLESGFTSAKDAAAALPATKYWNYFRVTRDRIPRSLEGIFPTIELLPELPLPVQLIHAVNDKTIPHQHSVALREAARDKQDVELFSAQTGEHRFVHRDEGAVRCASQFIERVCQQ